ncbi:MAG: GNAT family N-acetyltransferase [Chloroflexota bacterium]|nr:GNAT family N-acetyltransferase [Chloroflexota bacterium]
MMEIAPVTLPGSFVRLEPLQMKHASDLFAAAQDPALWTYMSAHLNSSLPAIEAWISAALQEQAAGMILPFAIIDISSGYAVGSTRYMAISLRDRGLEIGWTWLASSVQRTGANTECKYLLLRHAFETLGAIRVQLKTHHDNLRSQRAIERIGATREGVLRNHMIMPDGSYRHSVYYSIIDSEWPRVKGQLEAKMQQ